jgi:hypothetical protein
MSISNSNDFYTFVNTYNTIPINVSGDFASNLSISNSNDLYLSIEFASNLTVSTSNYLYPSTDFSSNLAVSNSNSLYPIVEFASNLAISTSNDLYPSTEYSSNLAVDCYTNIALLSNTQSSFSNDIYAQNSSLSNNVNIFSNDIYPKAFNVSGSTLYVQSNVSIGFGAVSSSLSVNGQILCKYDSNWSTGGIRFQSSSGSNDSGLAQGSNGFLRFLAPSNDGAGGFQWVNNAHNAIYMQLDSNGNLDCYGELTGYKTSISDSNFKKDVNALSNYGKYLSNLRPVSFTWSDNTPIKEKVGSWDIGLIAQEVAKAFPLAHKTSDFFGSNIEIVKYEKFIPILLAACKDYQERIGKLESLVSDMIIMLLKT